MGNIVYRCPRTGMHVQHWMAEEVTPDTPRCAYDTVVCKACAQIHFVNRLTGKLLGEAGTRTTRTDVSRRSAAAAS
ncbi:hypothetical protein [Bradyrhizobium sp.]|uniref:hypothetical protein n=1 Tax=Bradyrhizobium sp. TaxID=376 RepID=UPI002388DB37|nr:hypothetical protein [Bradyrhizobium sp.]MDE2378711.1 hypothetical protein [Bradyrhizobium sp.]